MNSKDSLKETIGEGIRTIAEKLPALNHDTGKSDSSNMLALKPHSEKEKSRTHKATAKKAVKKPIAKKSAKKKSRIVRRTIAAVLAGMLLIVSGAWFLLDLTGNQPVNVRSGWALALGAAAFAWMLSGRLVSLKLGAGLLFCAMFVRDNGMLGGVLDNVSIVQMLCVIAPIVVLLTAVIIFSRLKRCAAKGWFKTKKACTKQIENIRSNISQLQKDIQKKRRNKK